MGIKSGKELFPTVTKVLNHWRIQPQTHTHTHTHTPQVFCVLGEGCVSEYVLTLICSSRAVSRETSCVWLVLVTLCWPSSRVLLCWTSSWASSSHRCRISVGRSAGAMPWSGASW